MVAIENFTRQYSKMTNKKFSIKLWALAECVGYYESLGYERFEKDGRWYGMRKYLTCTE